MCFHSGNQDLQAVNWGTEHALSKPQKKQSSCSRNPVVLEILIVLDQKTSGCKTSFGDSNLNRATFHVPKLGPSRRSIEGSAVMAR